MDEPFGLDCLDDWSMAASEMAQDEQELDLSSAIPETEDVDEYEPPPPSTEDLNRALFDAHVTVARMSQCRLPWESGPFSWIFGSDSQVVPNPVQLAGNPRLVVPLPAAAEIEPGDEEQGCRKRPRSAIFSGVMKARTDDDAMEELHRLWIVALNKWLLVLQLTNYSGLVGEVVKETTIERDRQMAVRDALGLRSPRTAIKRANSVLRWLRWSASLGYQTWPPSAPALRTFLTDGGALGTTPERVWGIG